jgi:hypothetical protein
MTLSRVRGSLIGLASLALVQILHPLPANGYSSVPGTCDFGAILAVHGSAQPGTGGFSLASSSPTYSAGQAISITLSGTQSFKGLLLYVFDSTGTHRGAFTIPSGYQAMACPGDPSSTVGHSSATAKAVPVSFAWTAPTSTDPLTVAAAVMVNFSVWYVANPIVIQPAASGLDAGGLSVDGAGLLRIEPNPFQESTTIRYALPKEGAATLRVYDIGGRWVRTLIDGPQPAGTHAIDWDGRDDAGVALAAGVYFVRLETGGMARVEKLMRTSTGSAGE